LKITALLLLIDTKFKRGLKKVQIRSSSKKEIKRTTQLEYAQLGFDLPKPRGRHSTGQAGRH
jgi:hypothetical protein